MNAKRNLKRFLSGIFFIILILAAQFSYSDIAFAVADEKNNFELYFGPSEDKTKTIDNFFIDLVDSSKKSIDGCFFEIRLQSIVDAFIKARKRGVKIRIVTDTDNFNNEFVPQLLKAGIEVKSDNNRSALMHNKFAIVDSNKIWTGSYNLTDTCSYNNNNNALCFYSKELCEIYQREFNEMFIDGQFGATSPSTLEQQEAEVPIAGQQSKINVFFAPEDKPNEKIVELLKTAKKEIFFMHFAFTANEISDVLIDKARNDKVNVAGIFDSKLYRSTGPYSEFFKLTNEDIKIVLANNQKGKLHHKVFIVDPNSDDGFVITGSENSSNNGDGTNDENVIVIYNDKVAKAYFNEFKKLLGQFSDSYATSMNLYFKPEENISDANIVFNANGKPVDKIEVNYPARWPLSGKESVSIYTLDQKKWPKGSLVFNKKGFSAVNLGMKAFGKSSYIIFRFKNMQAPKIKGGYNLYIKCSHQPGKELLPLMSQPGFEITDNIATDAVASFDALLNKMTVSYSEMLNIRENSSNEEVFDNLFAHWMQNYNEITEMILTDAKNKDYDKFYKFMSIYDTLDADSRSKLGGFLKDLSEILKNNITSGDEAAADALKLIKK
ncbi:MAG: phospholipase D-like domain-containing protein [Candidatus Wallbacteria bacterium]